MMSMGEMVSQTGLWLSGLFQKIAIAIIFAMVLAGPVAAQGEGSGQGEPDAVVSIFQNDIFVGSGFIVGSKTKNGVLQLAILAPKSIISGRTTENVTVILKAESGQLEVIKADEINFARAYENRRQISRKARLPLTRVDRVLANTKYDNAMVVLFVKTTGAVPFLKMVDDSCQVGSGELPDLQVHFGSTRQFQTGNWGQADQPDATLSNEVLTGALVSSVCNGKRNVRYFLVREQSSGDRPSYIKALISTVTEGAKIVLLSKYQNMKFTYKYDISGAVSDCPGLDGRSMVAQYFFKEGDRIKVEEIPDRQSELHYVNYKNEEISRPRFPNNARAQLYTWGKNSRSKELFLLWTTGSDVVFERYCKSNLRPRGQFKTAVEFSGGQDSGWDYYDGSFFLSLGDGSAIYSSANLARPVRVLGIPSELEQVKKVTIDGLDVLVGWSRTGHNVQFTIIPRNLEMTTDESGNGTARFSWKKWAFPQKITASQREIRLTVSERYVSLLTNKGIAIASLDVERQKLSLLKMMLAKDNAGEFGSKKPVLMGSTIARFSESTNFALIAIYSHMPSGARVSEERVVIAPVLDGELTRLFSINNKSVFTEQAKKMKADHYASRERGTMFDLKVTKVHLTLDTPSELMERFFGAIIINVEFIKSLESDDGSNSRKDNFKIYYPIYFWYNKFDRMWEAIRRPGGVRPKNLCSGFNIEDINVITKRRRPIRIIVPKRTCGRQARPLTDRTQVEHISIVDSFGAQSASPND